MFFRLFFALTFLSFIRFHSALQHTFPAVRAVSPASRRQKLPRVRKLLEKNKMKKETKKTKKKDIFVFVFCYNFSVFPSISMFLVSKNHARRQQPFEAKNTQKLPRVRKLFAFKDQKRVEKRLKTVIVPSPELQLCRELWVAACPRPATQC